jgi:DNA-binding response OmpR family regulator
MKVLIVVKEKESIRKDEFEKAVNRIFREPKVVKLNRGISLHQTVSDISEEEILDSGGFDLIIHHCGGGNQEYGKFIKAYRQLCHRETWAEPIIILFTGGTGIKKTAKIYAQDPLICVASQPELARNLDHFLKTLLAMGERGGRLDRAPCHALRRKKKAESGETRALEHWKQLAHDVAYTFDEYPRRRDESRALLQRWSRAMGRSGPSQRVHLQLLQMLVNTDPSEVSRDQLVIVLDKLKISLGIKLSDGTLEFGTGDTDAASFPQRPPDSVSKVLVANDTPGLPLVSLLRTDFGYRVLTQARTLKTALHLLKVEKPNVVIADFRFPTESEGREFIREAKKADWEPIVIANSYGDLQDDDLPDGVVNYSGNDAHNPKRIHDAIWRAASRTQGGGEQTKEAVNSTDLEYTGKRKLEEYLDGINFYISRWSKFREEVVVYALRELRHRLRPKLTTEESSLIRQLIEAFEPFEHEKIFSYQTVDSLIEITGLIHKKIDSLPYTALSQDLRGICHDVESRSLKGVIYILSRLQKMLNSPGIISGREAVIGRLQTALDDCRKDFLLPQAERLSLSLRDSLATFPSIPADGTPDSRSETNKRFLILVAEDDEDWRNRFIVPIIEEVKGKLAESGHRIDYKTFDNKESALGAAPTLNKTRKIAPSRNGEATVIAVVDLYLPKDDIEVAKIKNSKKRAAARQSIIPRKKNGEELVRELRNRGLSVIVLSSSASRVDRLEFERLGVANIDYILKNFEQKDRFKAALIRNIDKPAAHVIENLGDHEKTQFRIDGIEIPLTRSENNTFEAVCELGSRGGSYSARDIIEHQGKDGREDTEQKCISTIRKKIQNTLVARGGKTIGKEEIIVTHQQAGVGKKARYGLGPAVNYIPYDRALEDAQPLEMEACRILVVEDDIETQTFICERLSKELGNVEIKPAANFEEALAAARDFRPDIVSLDLKIPADGSGKGATLDLGLDLLAEIRHFRNGIRAVIPTSAYRNKVLIDRAADLGVSSADIVPKITRGDWWSLLVDRVEKHRRELQNGGAAGIVTDFIRPVVEILPGCDLEAGRLILSVDGVPYANRIAKQKNGNQKGDIVPRIIGLLLLKAGRTVTWEEIGEWVGEDLSNDPRENVDDKRNWTKRCRHSVVKKWLKDPDQIINGEKVSELILRRPRTRSGLMLDVRVMG